MAQSSYRIPDSIDKSFLDTEISLSGEGATAVGKPISIKVILAWLLGCVILAFLELYSPIRTGGPVLMIAFGVFWVVLMAIMFKVDKSGSLRMTLVPIALKYLPRSARRVICRKSSAVRDFVGVSNIWNINQKTGMIEFLDGNVGFAYRVVGNASRLLFDSDRDAIVDRVDGFFRKIDTDTEWCFITTKEAQNVYLQLFEMQQRYKNLREAGVDDPDLLALADMEYKVLRNQVGNTFRSIHQYLVLISTSEDALRHARDTLAAEYEDSKLMFKQINQINGVDLLQMFARIYQGKESV